MRARSSRRSSTGTVVSSVWITRDLRTSALIAFQIGSSSQADSAIQPHKVLRDSSTPWRARMPSCRYSGQVIGELARDDLREQPRPRQSLLDRLGRLASDGDMLLAVAAGDLDPDMLDDEQRGRAIVEPLARLLPDRCALPPAPGAGPLLGRDFVDPPPARQVGRQRTPSMARERPGPRWGGRLRRRLRGRCGGSRLVLGRVHEEEQLVGIDSLRSRAVQPSQEEVEAMPELLDLPLRGPQAVRQLADHPVADDQVLG